MLLERQRIRSRQSLSISSERLARSRWWHDVAGSEHMWWIVVVMISSHDCFDVFQPVSRRWFDEDTPDPEAIKLADAILRAGMQQLPNNPYMILLYSSFLIDVQGSYQSGYGQLQAAKKADPRYTCTPDLISDSIASHMHCILHIVSWNTSPSSAANKSTPRRRAARRMGKGRQTSSATSSSRRTTGGLHNI